MEVFQTRDYEICNDGNELVTYELQVLINLVSKSRGKLIINRGKYLVSSVFLKSNMEVEFEEGSELVATIDENEYPIMNTRVAGIEMDWYVAVLNIIECSNVKVYGRGVINGNGQYWWNKYWGKDKCGGMRKEYDAKGLRAFTDYDCMRPRNLLISNSNNINIKGIRSVMSGFWNIHVLYSHSVVINDCTIDAGEFESPSTDGIDIDSSHDVVVSSCNLSCHDDSICIKSGRDGNGYEVGIACHDITIHDCNITQGMGVTIGSEVSGGIHDINVSNINFTGTDCGIRIKSSKARKGYIRDININNISMHNVKYGFNFFLDWNPQYNKLELPTRYEETVPMSWRSLMQEVPSSLSKTRVYNLTFKNITSTYDENCSQCNRLFHMIGYEKVPIHGINFVNVKANCKEYGVIKNVKDIEMINCQIEYEYAYNSEFDEYDNR